MERQVNLEEKRRRRRRRKLKLKLNDEATVLFFLLRKKQGRKRGDKKTLHTKLSLNYAHLLKAMFSWCGISSSQESESLIQRQKHTENKRKKVARAAQNIIAFAK